MPESGTYGSVGGPARKRRADPAGGRGWKRCRGRRWHGLSRRPHHHRRRRRLVNDRWRRIVVRIAIIIRPRTHVKRHADADAHSAPRLRFLCKRRDAENRNQGDCQQVFLHIVALLFRSSERMSVGPQISPKKRLLARKIGISSRRPGAAPQRNRHEFRRSRSRPAFPRRSGRILR
jgi:hypothetical protein